MFHELVFFRIENRKPGERCAATGAAEIYAKRSRRKAAQVARGIRHVIFYEAVAGWRRASLVSRDEQKMVCALQRAERCL